MTNTSPSDIPTAFLPVLKTAPERTDSSPHAFAVVADDSNGESALRSDTALAAQPHSPQQAKDRATQTSPATMGYATISYKSFRLLEAHGWRLAPTDTYGAPRSARLAIFRGEPTHKAYPLRLYLQLNQLSGSREFSRLAYSDPTECCGAAPCKRIMPAGTLEMLLHQDALGSLLLNWLETAYEIS